ncbi:MAG: hypothetical protein R6X25_13975 [Candidatus Krumholzibacteriia bacterium]
MNRKFLPVALLAATVALVGSAGATDEEAASLEAALSRAEATGRPVVIDFYTDW